MGFSFGLDYPYKAIIVKGTSGGANGLIEYVCEADPGVALTTAAWRIRKLVYDSSGFNTQVLWADSDRNFDNVASDPASLTYG